MSCCNNYLGEYPHNESVNTGIIASVTGIYTVRLQYGGVIIKKEIPTTQGQPIIITGRLNENYLYKFTVEDPNGNLISELACTNFSFRTYVNITSNCDTTCNEDSDSVYIGY